MKRTFVFASLLMLFGFSYLAKPQTQSLSLPARVPIHCSGPANNCIQPWALPNSTGVIVATYMSPGSIITDSLGDMWRRDFCFGGECFFSTHFNVQTSSSVTIIFPPTNGNDVYLLVYDGAWDFDSGNTGTYAADNSVFSDCINGQSCPYSWTHPIEVQSGELLISWSAPQATGPLLAHAGFGFTVESSDGRLMVEDMIAPTDGVYIGSSEWRGLDGSGSGGSHWRMAMAAYKRQ